MVNFLISFLLIPDPLSNRCLITLCPEKFPSCPNYILAMCIAFLPFVYPETLETEYFAVIEIILCNGLHYIEAYTFFPQSRNRHLIEIPPTPIYFNPDSG